MELRGSVTASGWSWSAVKARVWEGLENSFGGCTGKEAGLSGEWVHECTRGKCFETKIASELLLQRYFCM